MMWKRRADCLAPRQGADRERISLLLGRPELAQFFPTFVSRLSSLQDPGKGCQLGTAGAGGSRRGCGSPSRRAPQGPSPPSGQAAAYLLQQRDGVPAVVQPRGEAGRGGRVVVLGGLGDELGHGDLVRHPAAGGTRHKRGRA